MPATANGFRYPLAGAAPNVPQDLQNLATDVQTYVTSLQRVAPTDLTVASGFENWGFGYRNLCYWREGRTVNVIGTVRLLANMSPQTTLLIATLPTGFRPTGTIVFGSITNARTQVLSTGQVNLENDTFGVTLQAGLLVPVNAVIPLG